MKKILLIFVLFLLLFGCDKKGCNNEVVEFGHSGILTYYLDENPEDALKDIKLKVMKNGKETIFSLNHQNIKIENFNFDKVGEYTSVVTYNNKNYSLKYRVEIRKWNSEYDLNWYDQSKNMMEIKNAMELAGLAKLVNEGNDFKDKTITLKYDIDLNNKPWTPIGTNGIGFFNELNKYFSGTFDGNGHSIYNLYYKTVHPEMGGHLDSQTSYYHFGLFGYIKNAVIKNIKIQNVNIINGMGNEYKRSFQGTGALAGYTSGTTIIENAHVLGEIQIKGEYKVAGLIGSCSGDSIFVKNSSVRGNENSFIGGNDEEYQDTNNFGGIVGFTSTSQTILENIISDINVDGYTCGGIVGNVTEGKLELKKVCVYGTISNKEGSVVGGFVGGRFVSMTLSDCYFLGTVSSKEKTYADVCVSKYGDSGENIMINNVYYNSELFNNDKVNNSLNALGKTKEELIKLLPNELK